MEEEPSSLAGEEATMDFPIWVRPKPDVAL
jgi:hypothetical protein